MSIRRTSLSGVGGISDTAGAKRDAQEVKTAMTVEVRNMTLRLPAETANQLELLAQIQNVSLAEQVRRALAKYVESMTKDPECTRELLADFSRRQRAMEALIAGGGHEAQVPPEEVGKGRP